MLLTIRFGVSHDFIDISISWILAQSSHHIPAITQLDFAITDAIKESKGLLIFWGDQIKLWKSFFGNKVLKLASCRGPSVLLSSVNCQVLLIKCQACRLSCQRDGSHNARKLDTAICQVCLTYLTSIHHGQYDRGEVISCWRTMCLQIKWQRFWRP